MFNLNSARRKKINSVVNDLKNMRDIIDGILNEEQEVFDNTPENIQDSYKGERMQDAISQLEDSVENIEYAIESLEAAST